jgi:CheY-like chemotaxis protein
VVTLQGGSALSLAREFLPGAITLDISLPDMAGWTILDRLKHDPATRHIPVHVITGDENRRRGLALGAMTYLEKSVTNANLNAAFDTIHHSLKRRTKKLMLIAEEEGRRTHWKESLGGGDIETVAVGSAEALAIMKQRRPDGIVLDLRLAGIPAAQLMETLQAEGGPSTPPMVVCGPQNPGAAIEAEIRRLSRQSVIRYAGSPERLLQEAVLFLHRSESDLSDSQREILTSIRRSDARLAGKNVLVVDDDVRNIFALSTVLEQHGLHVVHAENGRAGIETLMTTPGIDGVLMDIMMPEMDGYETIRAIRQIAEFRSLPIIAVTAKAMKGDRAKCIAAGASDYITKPVDLEQLFSVLRVWLVEASYSSSTTVTAAG